MPNLPNITVWTDAQAIIDGVWGIVISVLDALETALSNVFVQILFAAIVFAFGTLVLSKVITLVKKIGGK